MLIKINTVDLLVNFHSDLQTKIYGKLQVNSE
jgi:hypothetical protein